MREKFILQFRPACKITDFANAGAGAQRKLRLYQSLHACSDDAQYLRVGACQQINRDSTGGACPHRGDQIPIHDRLRAAAIMVEENNGCLMSVPSGEAVFWPISGGLKTQLFLFGDHSAFDAEGAIFSEML